MFNKLNIRNTTSIFFIFICLGLSQVHANATTVDWVQIKTPTAPIQMNAFEASKAIYETVSGNIFQVKAESFFFYQIILPNQKKAWIDKSFVKSTSQNQQLTAASITPLTPTYNYGYLSKKPHTDPPDYQNKHTQQLNIDGFYKIEFSGRDYTPKDTNDPRWTTVTNDALYKKLPQDVLLGPIKQEHSFKFSLDSHLSEDLYLYFDIESIPDFPKKWDVRVKLKDNTLSFGDIETSFANGSYSNIKKSINGIKFQKENDRLNFILANGKQRSNPQKSTFTGNGGRKYNLKHSSILPGTVKVWVNNKSQGEGKDADYTFDYYTGEILFNANKIITDVIEVVYEFTNPIEDFLPILNRKEFTGFQTLWNSEAKAKKEFIIKNKSESIPLPQAAYNQYQLKHWPIIVESDSVYINEEQLFLNQDYLLDYDSGQFTFVKAQNSTHNMTLSYRYINSEVANTFYIGKDSPGPFVLDHSDILKDSIRVIVDGKPAAEIRDYLILKGDNERSQIIFNYPIPFPQLIAISYRHKLSTLKKKASDKKSMNAGLSYFEEKIHNNKDSLIKTQESTFTVKNNRIAVPSANTPLTELDSIEIINGNNTFTPSETQIQAYKGVITGLDAYEGKTVTMRYKYKNSERALFSFVANKTGGSYDIDKSNYSHFQAPMRYGGIIKIIVDNIELIAGDYEVNWGEDGTKINLKFLDTNPIKNQAAQNIPQNGDKIDIFYAHTPDIVVTGMLRKKQIGLTFGKQINEYWRVDTEIAGASDNFSRQTEETSEIVKGNNSRSIQLSNKKLKENSENLFINNGSKAQANWVPINEYDYYINPSTGEIIFNEIIASTKEIKADYTYFLSSSQAIPSKNHGMSYAKKLATTYKNDKIKAHMDYQKIDLDYSPLSPISESKGSRVLNTDFTWQITTQNSVNSSYANQKQEVKHKESNIKDTLDIGSKLLLFKHIESANSLSVTREHEKHTVKQENAKYKVDKLSYSSKQGLKFGPKYLRASYDNNFSKSKSDYRDKLAIDESFSIAHDIGSTLKLKKLFLLGAFTFNPSFSYSKTQSKTAKNIHPSLKTTQREALSTTFLPLSYWSNSLSFSRDKSFQRSETLSVISNTLAQNYHYKSTFKPKYWLSSFIDIYHKENISQLTQSMDIDQDTLKGGISSFKPIGVMKALKISPKRYLYRSFRYSNASASFSNNSTKQKNYQLINRYRSSTYNLSAITLFRHANLKSLSYSNSRQNTHDYQSSTDSKESFGHTRSHDADLSFAYFPTRSWLRKLSYSLSLDDSNQRQLSTAILHSNQHKITNTRKPVRKQKHALNMNPYAIKYKNRHLIDYSGSYKFNQENTQSFSSTSYPGTTASSDLDPIQQSDQSISEVHTLDSKLSRYFYYKNFGPLSYTNNFKYSHRESIKETKYTVQSKKNTQASDIRFLHKLDQNLSLKPFQKFTLKSGLNLGKEDNSVINDSSVKTFINSYGIKINPSFPLIKRITLTSGFSQNGLTQFVGNKASLSLDDLKLAYTQAKNGQNNESFSSRIRQTSQAISVGLSYSPFKILTLSAAHSQSYSININSAFSSLTFNENEQKFLVLAESLTSILTPLKALKISSTFKFNHSKNRSNTSNNNFQKGYQHQLIVTYLPLRTRYVNVSISYSKNDNWGTQMNENTQKSEKELSGKVTDLKITKQNNSQEVGSLSINITYPFKNTPHIEKITIIGEGYLKRKKDKYNTLYNYSLSGLKIEATLHL
eukprot:COSAG01_NODE_9_length_43729_cov_66.133463_24_plen_1729_part_00